MGGRRGFTPTEDVHGLVSGKWTRIGSINTSRTFPIVAVIPGDSILIVCSLSSSPMVAVELAWLSLSYCYHSKNVASQSAFHACRVIGYASEKYVDGEKGN